VPDRRPTEKAVTPLIQYSQLLAERHFEWVDCTTREPTRLVYRLVRELNATSRDQAHDSCLVRGALRQSGRCCGGEI
jgi:hypothetical protein